LTGSLANIIAVERAAEVGLKIGFLEHARIGVPITVSLAGCSGWPGGWLTGLAIDANDQGRQS
jgi:hypothetical protein